jgi:hypothetical protein
VLIPSQKWTYIYDNWPKSWIEAAKASVQSLWDGLYKPAIVPISLSDLEPSDAKSGFERWAKAKQQRYQPLPRLWDFVQLNSAEFVGTLQAENSFLEQLLNWSSVNYIKP